MQYSRTICLKWKIISCARYLGKIETLFTVRYQKQRAYMNIPRIPSILRGRLVLQRITPTNYDIFTLQDMHLERMHNTVHFDRLHTHRCLILIITKIINSTNYYLRYDITCSN